MPQAEHPTQSAADAHRSTSRIRKTNFRPCPTSVPSVGPQRVAVKIPPTRCAIARAVGSADGETADAAAARADRGADRKSRPRRCRSRAQPRRRFHRAALVAKATTAPSASPKPAAAPSAAPAASAGVPSPSPTKVRSNRPKPARAVARVRRAKARRVRSPAPVLQKPVRLRPIAVPPTPSPKPAPARRRRRRGPAEFTSTHKLRACSAQRRSIRTKTSQGFHASLRGSMEPTPPPEVVGDDEVHVSRERRRQRRAGQDVGNEHASRRAGTDLRWLAACAIRTPSQPDAQAGTMTHPVGGARSCSAVRRQSGRYGRADRRGTCACDVHRARACAVYAARLLRRHSPSDSRLLCDFYRTRIGCSITSDRRAEEGGWNRRIHRAIWPANTRTDSGATGADASWTYPATAQKFA